jgi:hypothetical protein
LAVTRQELEQVQEKARALESENEQYWRDIEDGALVKKAEVDQLKASLAEEKAQRILAEKEKKGIEQELETLTAALFEEANKVSKYSAPWFFYKLPSKSFHRWLLLPSSSARLWRRRMNSYVLRLKTQSRFSPRTKNN